MSVVFRYSSGEFPARVLRSRTVGGFVCTETNYLPKQAIGNHSHNTAGLVAALKGSFTERLGTRQIVCEPLSLLYRSPGDVHSDLFGDSGGRCLTIEIPRVRIEEIINHVPDTTVLLNDAPTSLGPAALRLYREFRDEDRVSPLALEALILELIAGFSRRFLKKRTGKDERTAMRAREFIYDRWIDGLTLTGIAEEVGVHPSHLARVFREEFGVTIGKYIRTLRVRASAEQLSTTETPLARIAADCGFSDQSHFCREFKRATGLTPLEYRRSSTGGLSAFKR
ncbi:MAG: helix-turn-helix transcriptional regulator [Aridibacter famidurans]|nr:helix-turn-helix transcriptional regulator [Aridibacter famidurans]